MNDSNTVILGKPLKRLIGATRWHDVMHTPVQVSAETWVRFVAVMGLERKGSNLWTDGTCEYMFERRRDDHA